MTPPRKILAQRASDFSALPQREGKRPAHAVKFSSTNISANFCAEIGGSQFVRPHLAIGGLDQPFENIKCRCLNTVAQQEFLAAREFFDGEYQPKLKPICGFKGRSRASSSPPHKR
ncbi:MAG TPA: hypothetical protein VJQ06_03870 [Rhizomicrobium sp.]|nr:hypothetical protein [Rhizomicrobium sp.]